MVVEGGSMNLVISITYSTLMVVLSLVSKSAFGETGYSQTFHVEKAKAEFLLKKPIERGIKTDDPQIGYHDYYLKFPVDEGGSLYILYRHHLGSPEHVAFMELYRSDFHNLSEVTVKCASKVEDNWGHIIIVVSNTSSDSQCSLSFNMKFNN